MGDKELLKIFYDQVGEKYPEEESVYHTLRGKLRKKFVINWLKQQSGSLLEIGTNRGMYLQHYKGGARFGVDLSQTVLRTAHHEKPVFYAVADAERLYCFKSGVFERVLCSEVIEHCFHPEEVFHSIAHVLKSNGRALLTTPNYRRQRPTWVELDVMTNYGIKSTWQEKYFHTAYRPEELAAFAGKAGLDVVQCGTLEKEIKYVAKIPAVILLVGRVLNKMLKSQRFGMWNEDLFQKLSNFIYLVTHYTLFEKCALLFVKEGVRSYIIVEKT
ncbi:methyltransferase domain-containing protein [candidate division KSB1 bacterium]|nr:methyltransferase domain-containing protein [candidate division KSB1 bacterium]